MKSRFLSATLWVALMIAPAAAQAPAAKPLVTAQSQPLGQILDSVKTAARAVGGNKAVEQIEEAIKDKLGEKGFTGLDLTRRIVGYGDLAGEVEKSSGFVVIPITGEEEFKDFLARLGPDDDKLKLTPVDGNPGLYIVETPDGDAEVPVRLRFHDRAAYIGFNVPDDAMAAEKLLPAAAMIRPTDNAVFSYEAHLGRYPEDLKGKTAEQMKQLREQMDGAPLPPGFKKAASEILSLSERLSKQMVDEGDVAAYRFRFDPQTVTAAVEVALIPKAGTKLAAEIAAWKPTTNRFAGLVGKDTAGGFLLSLPLFTPELRNAIEAGLDEGVNLAASDVPEDFQPVVEELKAALVRTVKTGQFDVAASVDGPNDADQYQVAVAVSLEDTAKLEKQLRDLFDKFKADQPALNFIKLDVAKVGNVNIHEAPLGAFVPPPAQAIFGKNSSAFFAFGPHGIYVTFGPTALDAIKKAVTLEPSEAKIIDVIVNPARMQKLIAAANPDAADDVANVFDKDDQKLSAFSISVKGGTELQLTYGLNLKLIIKPIMMSRTSESSNFEGAVPAVKE